MIKTKTKSPAADLLAQIEAINSRKTALRKRDAELLQRIIEGERDSHGTSDTAGDLDIPAAAAALASGGEINWDLRKRPQGMEVLRKEREAIALAIVTLDRQGSELRQQYGVLELARRTDEMRSLLFERAILVAKLQGLNRQWQRVIAELVRAGCDRGGFLLGSMPAASLLGTGPETHLEGYKHLQFLIKHGVITASEVVRARGEDV